MIGPRAKGELVAEIVMQRTAWSGSFVVVEGIDDYRFWRPRCVAGNCDVLCADGKSVVLSAVSRLHERQVGGVLGLVDDDGDRWQAGPALEEIVATDAWDLEATLLLSPVLDRLLIEFGDAERIAAFQRDNGPVSEALVARSISLGRIRLLDRIAGPGLDFGQLKVPRFCRSETWHFDEQALVAAVAEQGTLGTEEEIRAQLAGLPPHDPPRTCHGKDMLDILAAGLQNVLGSQSNAQRLPGTLAAMARQSLSQAELMATEMAASIRVWECYNEPYCVLRDGA